MTILLIEDEEATARKLQRLLVEVEPSAKVVGQLSSVEESVAWLKAQPTPDLILLDIELADGQSFEIFNQVVVTSPVIFTTAYDEYAIRAFRVNSIDYLLKPIKEADLRRALAKLRTMKDALSDQSDSLQTALVNLLHQLPLSLNSASLLESPVKDPSVRHPPAESRSGRERFLVKQGQRLLSIPIHEVAYFFSRNKMTFIQSAAGPEWLIDYTMEEVEQLLDPHRFFRINRQIIVELRAIKQVNLYFNGKLKITLHPTFSDDVLVSRDRAGGFRRWLGE
ncbi:LytTR family DNA-binding domain-containing protein [Spirosoma humi]